MDNKVRILKVDEETHKLLKEMSKAEERTIKVIVKRLVLEANK